MTTDARAEPTSDVLPNTLEVALKAIGVISTKPKEPKVERSFTFRTPTFDENGEPDF